MTSSEIRKRFIEFFQKRGHVLLPSASLVPENDPSVLFNTAGMQALVPYLLGQPHPQGTRLVNIQKCVRTVDIDEIGDNTHATFFEMMGNWSLGDYGKNEAIRWSYELLTSKEEGFGLDPQGMYVTCFEGDETSPRDQESAQIWKEIFEENNVTGERIYFLSANKNWWSAGENGPCGPDTEMFYDLTGNLRKGMTMDEYFLADDEQKVVEVWNDVFMEYLKKDGKVVGKLDKKNVDTGSGFERMVAVIEGKNNIFDTSFMKPLMDAVRSHSIIADERVIRVIADHVRTAVFIISEGVTPSNTDRGYILRRLLRRAILKAQAVKLTLPLQDLVQFVTLIYLDIYPDLISSIDRIKVIFSEESDKFSKTLQNGDKELTFLFIKARDDNRPISGNDLFKMFTTYGFPIESSLELLDAIFTGHPEKLGLYNKNSILLEFANEMQKHQQLSRAGAEQKFKGGLAGTGEMEIKYHTATHLLHQALRDILGDSVKQSGSNITSERLRFDFSFERKMSDDEKKRVEDTVNEKIQLKLPMNKIIMKRGEAEQVGALHFFADTYGETVDVYYLGDSLETAYSKEFCGGPHVSNTSELKHFKIIKEEAVSSGVRRIKAVLE